MYAAGDSAGALPPFNLSCQVRRRCFYICSELAAEVQLDRWGQLLNTAGTRKPSWAFHAGLFVDLLTRFSRLSFVLRVLRVQEDALWVSGEPCSHAPAKLTTVPFFVTATKWQLLFFFSPLNSRSGSSWDSFTCCQAHTRPPAIQRAWWHLQACGARPACLSRTLFFKLLPHLSTARRHKNMCLGEPELTQTHHPALFQPQPILA